MMRHQSKEEEVSEGMERGSEEATADETVPIANLTITSTPDKARIKSKYHI